MFKEFQNQQRLFKIDFLLNIINQPIRNNNNYNIKYLLLNLNT